MNKDLEYNALKLHSEGRHEEQRILNAFSNAGIGRQCYAYKIRVKSEERLVEKVIRKTKEKKNYGITDVTDVIGLRLITLFRTEISQILSEALLLIEHKKELKPNPFKQDSLEEAIIYSSSLPHDSFQTELQGVFESHGIPFTVKHSKEGYSSVHLVSRLNKSTMLRSGDAEIPLPIPVEIQIRSVFEDAWGEIDHRFGYAFRSGKQNVASAHNAPLAQPHLKVLKSFTDACAQYADTIYAIAQTPLELKSTAGRIMSVPSDDEVIRRFQSIGVPQKLCDSYVKGRQLREAALKEMAFERSTGQARCLQASTYFIGLTRQANAELSDHPAHLYTYYTRMNEALCLLSTDFPQHVKLAELLYIKLREEYPKFILVKFRLAQAYARLGQTADSIELFQQTSATLSTQVTNDGAEWPDHLPQADYEHMIKRLPKLLGYQYWKRSDEVLSQSERLELLVKAHDITLTADSKDPHTHNNLVHYAVEFLSTLDPATPPSTSSKRLATSLHANLFKMEQDKEAIANDIGSLDTMMRAYNFLGKHGRAREIANHVVELIKNSSNTDPEEALDTLKAALQIISLQLPEMQTPLDKQHHV